MKFKFGDFEFEIGFEEFSLLIGAIVLIVWIVSAVVATK